jgi:hypothetical protein
LSVSVVWQDEADADLDRILDNIEKESPRGALTMALAIRHGGPRPNSRVTSRQIAQSIGSRASMSRSKRP